MLQRDLRRRRIEQKCAPKPPPIRPHKPLQTNGGTDERPRPPACPSERSYTCIGGACFSGISGAAGLNKNVPPNRRQFALINHCKQMGAQMSAPGLRPVHPSAAILALVGHASAGSPAPPD